MTKIVKNIAMMVAVFTAAIFMACNPDVGGNEPETPETPETPENPENPEIPETSEPTEGPEAPEEPKLNFFQRIWQAIVSFFQNLFGKKK